MNRIVAIVLVVALLIAGGFWLAQRSASDEQANETPAATEAEASDSAPGAELELPEGFSLTPFLSDTPKQSFEQAEQVLVENTDYRAILQTNKGTMVLELFEDQTPLTVNNFVFLALNRYYENVVFHRVLDDFMAQTGDPTGTGRGGPGYQFADEIASELKHDDKGMLSMANAGPNTNGSQFFLTFTATPWLDGRHTIFGRVIEGIDVLDKLQRIDPQTPQAVAQASDPLTLLSEQGINLAGQDDVSIESYLAEKLGAMPSVGQTFSLDSYTGVVGRIGDNLAVGFFPKPDFIERVYIIQRPKN